MKNKTAGGVVEDIWMNTQVSTDDYGDIERTEPDSPPQWEEIEEENILINPDAASMEDRG